MLAKFKQTNKDLVDLREFLTGAKSIQRLRAIIYDEGLGFLFDANGRPQLTKKDAEFLLETYRGYFVDIKPGQAVTIDDSVPARVQSVQWHKGLVIVFVGDTAKAVGFGRVKC